MNTRAGTEGNAWKPWEAILRPFDAPGSRGKASGRSRYTDDIQSPDYLVGKSCAPASRAGGS
jgi:hypothetical protein